VVRYEYRQYSFGSGQEQMTGSFENDNEFFGSTKGMNLVNRKWVFRFSKRTPLHGVR
jgi:hypothetical protein